MPGKSLKYAFNKKVLVYTLLVLILLTSLLCVFIWILQKRQDKKVYAQEATTSGLSPIAKNDIKGQGNISFNIPAIFNQTSLFTKSILVEGDSVFKGNIEAIGKDINLGDGKIFASNIQYRINVGDGIGVDPTDPNTLINTGVKSFQGQSGEISFTGRDGVSINGLTITNTDKGSAQSIFKFISVIGSERIEAKSNNDTLSFEAGDNIKLDTDPRSKKIKISVIDITSGDVVTSFQGQTGSITLNSGPGIDVNGLTIQTKLHQSGISAISSSGSGLEVTNAGISLLKGCSNGQMLKWDATNNIWSCGNDLGGSVAVINVNEGSTSYNDNDTLVFNQNDFSVSQSGSTATINIDYANSQIARKNQNETISGNWTFNSLTTGIVVNTNGTLSSQSQLDISRGGTGSSSFNNNGIVFGNGTNLGSTSAGTTNQLLMANSSGIPVFVSVGGDLSNNSGIFTIGPDAVALGADTTGNYVSSISTGNGLTGGNPGSEASALTINLQLTSSGTSTTTQSNSGLETSSSGLGLIRGCSNDNILAWDSVNNIWKCNTVTGVGAAAAGSGVTSVNGASGALTINGGGINSITTVGNAITIMGTEADTLASVTARGGSTSSNLSLSGNVTLTAIANMVLTTNGTGQIGGVSQLGIIQGGTGSSTATGARTNIGAAASGANSDITSISGLTTALSVSQGGTGLTSVTANTLIYGNGSGTLLSTNVGTAGQILIANASGTPTFVSLSGDGSINSSGVFTISADSVALGSDTIGNYVQSLQTGNGLSGGNAGSEGSTLNINLALTSSGDSLTTQSNSGLETSVSGLGLIRGCSNDNVLAWDSTSSVWKCNTITGIGGAASGSGVTALNSQTGALTIAGGGINSISVSGSTITVTGTESDTLASVTSRGATTSANLTLSGLVTITNSGGLVMGEDIASGSVNIPGKITFVSGGDNSFQTSFTAGNQTENINYTLPLNSGVLNQVLTTDGTGSLSWQDVSGLGAGIGTITGIGDVTSGTAFTSGGTQGVSIWFYDPEGRGQLTIANLTSPRTYTLPDASGEVSVLGQTIENSELSNSSITINTSGGISGGGLVSLGGTLSLTNTGVTALNSATGNIIITGGGINTVNTSGNTVTVTGTEVDGIIGNEVIGATNGTLTRSGAGTAGDPYTLGLNLANANTWTALQTFGSGLTVSSGLASLNNGATITSVNSSSVGLVVNAVGSQVANLQEWKISSGDVIASLNTGGKLTLTSASTPVTSYANTGGTGNRTGIITATKSAGLTDFNPTALIDGNMSNTNYWQSVSAANQYLLFDFGTGKIIDEALWTQQNPMSHGTWKWQGSYDGTNFTDIGATFTLGGGVSVQTQTSLSSNTTAFRYYRLFGVGGTTNNGWYIRELEFKIAAPLGDSITSVFSGSAIGIGDASPDAPLEILSTSTQVLISHTDGLQDATIGVDASGNLTFASNGTTGKITLQANGALTTGTVQVGSGGSGSTTPDLLGLDVKSNAGDPTGFNGAMYYNANLGKFRCYQNSTWTDCIGSVSTSNLYAQGGNTFGTTGILGTNDNNGLNIVTNGTARLNISSDGNISADIDTLFVDAANNRIGIGTTSLDTKLTVSDNSGASQAKFMYDSSNYLTLFVASNGAVTFNTTGAGAVFNFLDPVAIQSSLTVGLGGNTFTFDPSTGPNYAGTARPTKTMVLNAEYPGSTLITDGSSTTSGSMTSDNDGSSGAWRNYYEWTSVQGNLQDYTIAVRVTLPEDFSAFETNALDVAFQTGTNSTADNTVSMNVNNTTSNPNTAMCSVAATASTAWSTMSCSDSSFGAWTTTDRTAIIRIKLASKNTANAKARVGTITLRYKAKF
jgi:hypothetical protein